MTEDVAIKVEHITKTFKERGGAGTLKNAFVSLGHKITNTKDSSSSKKSFTALKDINFEVKKGEFFGIVGRNGSGKSTLLKIIAGVYNPTKGAVTINGKLTPFIELGVGFNPELSGRDNVYLNAALLGFSRKQTDLMYDDIVEFAELKDFMETKLKNYSSGMQVRLAFSVAIRARSEIILIDEVLAVGDAAFQKKCFDYFMQLRKDKRTVILVTHDMSAVRQYCDRAIMINKSKLVKMGTADEIAQEYQKLFSVESSGGQVVDTSSVDRWGTGAMRGEITKFKVTDEQIRFTCQYSSKSDVGSPILGFTIYGPSGANILEGNTKRMLRKVPQLKAGGSVSIEWSVPNILATGSYAIAVACCDQSAVEFYDWHNNAAKFIIDKDGNTAGIVDPTLTIERIE